jgi:hypothetical protein
LARLWTHLAWFNLSLSVWLPVAWLVLALATGKNWVGAGDAVISLLLGVAGLLNAVRAVAGARMGAVSWFGLRRIRASQPIDFWLLVAGYGLSTMLFIGLAANAGWSALGSFGLR